MIRARILNRILDLLHTGDALGCELGTSGVDE